MAETINPNDLRRITFKLVIGGQSIRLDHVSTGLVVDGSVGKDESPLKLHDSLMKKLNEKVAGKHSS